VESGKGISIVFPAAFMFFLCKCLFSQEKQRKRNQRHKIVCCLPFWQGQYGDRKEKRAGKNSMVLALGGKPIARAAYFTLLIFIIAN